MNAHEYEAVRHILTSPALETRTAPYIQAGGYDWAGLLAEAEAMSGGERALIRIAHDLWNAEPLAGVWEIPKRLDSRNFERVIEALYIYRGDDAGRRSLRLLPLAA
jgi:hypothetical protein